VAMDKFERIFRLHAVLTDESPHLGRDLQEKLGAHAPL